MLALDLSDKIRGDASSATVVDYTLHGIVGTTVTQLADGQLAAAIGDLYTAASAGIAVLSIVLVNTDSSARTVNLYLTPSAGTARRLIPKDLSLGAGYSLIFDGQKCEVLDTAGNLMTSLNLTNLGVNASIAELNYSVGVTSAIQTQLNLKAPLASPTFTGTVTLPSTVTVGAAVLTFPGATGTFATLAGSEELDNKTLDSPVLKGTATASGTVTLPAITLGGDITAGGYDLTDIGDIRITSTKNIYPYPSAGAYFLLLAPETGVGSVEVARVQGGDDPYFGIGGASEIKVYNSGIITLLATKTIVAASGVVGFSVVSTALTLGSAGSMIVPVADMVGAANDAARDVLAGNVNGATCVDAAGLFFCYRRNGLWYKAAGVAMV